MNYYDVLLVDRKATQDEIKLAYRNLMKHYHPDICKEENADKMSKDINNAMDVLGNVDERIKYDEYLRSLDDKTFENFKRNKRQRNTEYDDSSFNQSYYEYEAPVNNKWDYLFYFLKNGNMNHFAKDLLGLLTIVWFFISWIIKTVLSIFAFIVSIVAGFAALWASITGGLALILLFANLVGFMNSIFTSNVGFNIAIILGTIFIVNAPYLGAIVIMYCSSYLIDLIEIVNTNLIKKIADL